MTVTIEYCLFDPPAVFTGVTFFEYDPETGQVKIIFDKGTFENILDNVFKITIK